jgi:hypothetical protein
VSTTTLRQRTHEARCRSRATHDRCWGRELRPGGHSLRSRRGTPPECERMPAMRGEQRGRRRGASPGSSRFSGRQAPSRLLFALPRPRSCCRRSGIVRACRSGKRSREQEALGRGSQLSVASHAGVWTPAAYASSRIQSATRSAIMMQVRLMFARGMAGMIEASTTRRFSTPRTQPYWSTTAIGLSAGPICAVPQG